MGKQSTLDHIRCLAVDRAELKRAVELFSHLVHHARCGALDPQRLGELVHEQLGLFLTAPRVEVEVQQDVAALVHLRDVVGDLQLVLACVKLGLPQVTCPK